MAEAELNEVAEAEVPSEDGEVMNEPRSLAIERFARRDHSEGHVPRKIPQGTKTRAPVQRDTHR